ncbi:MAG: hypothetical protein JWN24_5038 [Phycisphaerales bacterium]|nr:hypothetical protein [Phycisphaerales bacterium]
MRRRLFTLLSALSLLLFVATCVMWVRSYWQGDEFTVLRRSEADCRIAQYNFYSGRGVIYVARVVYVFGTPEQAARFGPPSGILRGSLDPALVPLDGRGALAPRMGADRSGAAYAIIPDWCVALPLLIPVAWWIIRAHRIRRRRLRMECPSCGYDLRATPDRCPECGAVR